MGECKAWVLKGHKKGDLRVLVVNKVNAKDCGVDIKLSKEQVGAGRGRVWFVMGW